MNWKSGSTWTVAALTVLVTAVAACGSTNSSGTTSKGTITVAGFNFPESSVLAELYGQALAHDGYSVNYKLNLGTRKVVAPALQSGQIDIYPGYAASELEYYNNGAGEATADPAATTTKLNTYLAKINAQALTPSQAFDGNAYAVTQGHRDQVQPQDPFGPDGDRRPAGLRCRARNARPTSSAFRA